jgi:flagellar protein FliJ
MIKSKRFESIHEIASISARDLCRVMGDAGRKVAELERQLEQLQAYRDEYLRNSTQSGGAMDAVKLQNYRSFLGRLGQAMTAHQESLDLARREFDKRREQWSEKRVEAESLNRVVDRFRKEEQNAADRHEQREGDDTAMRRMLATRTDTGTA